GATAQHNNNGYYGVPLGELTRFHHGVRGNVFAVDARTLHIRDLHYDGEGPAAYFYAGNSKAPGAQGFRIRDERGSAAPLKRYRGKHVTITLPEGKTLHQLKWFAIWCEEFSVNFGDVRIPKNLELPKPHKIGSLSGIHGVSSDPVVVVDAQTLLVPSFSYDGEAPDAKFWVGRGPKPSPQGIRVPDENGKEVPLRRYEQKTLVLTLPGDLTVFDIGHFGVWCEAFAVDFGHVQIPRSLSVPPSLRMLGVQPQKQQQQQRSLQSHPAFSQGLPQGHGLSSPPESVLSLFNAAQTVRPTTYRPHTHRRQPAPTGPSGPGPLLAGPLAGPFGHGLGQAQGQGPHPASSNQDESADQRGRGQGQGRPDFGGVALPNAFAGLDIQSIQPSQGIELTSPQQAQNFLGSLQIQQSSLPHAPLERISPPPEQQQQQLLFKDQRDLYAINNLADSNVDVNNLERGGRSDARPPLSSFNNFQQPPFQQQQQQQPFPRPPFPPQQQNFQQPSPRFQQNFHHQQQPQQRAFNQPFGQQHQQQGFQQPFQQQQHPFQQQDPFRRLSKLNCEVLHDDLAFEVRWAVAGDSVVLQLVAKLEDNEYMAFGLSGDSKKSVMIGGDVVVAWVDKNTLKGTAVDYILDAKSQCSGTRGSCPDTRIKDNSNSVRLLNAALVNGYSIVTYQRPLAARDSLDKPVLTNGSQPVIWAVGPLNQRQEVSYHSLANREDIFLEFGRAPRWNCPLPDGGHGGAQDDQDREPARPAQQQQQVTAVTTRPPATPAPHPTKGAWEIPPIQCHEPEDGVFYAQMGPTGGKHGYPAITGHVGWGISWYINGLLIPEINVVRGKTYTFVVEGGLDPETPARYHPFYITDDSVGGFEHKTPEERANVRIFAGAVQDKRGNIVPTGTGRLCNWTPDPNQPLADEFSSFGAYQRTLTLVCDEGEPGVVQWTPDHNTPDTVYYQCFTHRYLGWKINVLDSCDRGSQGAASEPVPAQVPAPGSGATAQENDKQPASEAADQDGDLDGKASIQVETRVPSNAATSQLPAKDLFQDIKGLQGLISDADQALLIKGIEKFAAAHDKEPYPFDKPLAQVRAAGEDADESGDEGEEAAEAAEAAEAVSQES
ncbi:Protein Skeletor, isoforms D/E, partial [Frankliniella fusca]